MTRSTVDGSLTFVDRAFTGGTGSDGNGPAGTAVGADDLTSQYAVTVSTDNTKLFAVNAASNSISVFSINATTGSLTLLATTTVAGNFPNSLTYNNGYLYVSFTGNPTIAASPMVGAYQINSNGSLTQVDN
jgi:6-phosphogluconolactonase (cycloisomerase 2 family)